MVVAVEVHPHPADTSLISIRMIEGPPLPHSGDDEDFATSVAVDQYSFQLDGDYDTDHGEGGGGERDASHTSRHNLDNTRASVNTYRSILNITEDDDDEDCESDVDDARRQQRSFLLFEDMAENPVDTSLVLQVEGDEGHHPFVIDFDDDPLLENAPPTPPIRSKCCDPTAGCAPVELTPPSTGNGAVKPNNNANNTAAPLLATTSSTVTDVAPVHNNSLFDLPEKFIQSLCFGNDNCGGGNGVNNNSDSLTTTSTPALTRSSSKQSNTPSSWTSIRRVMESDIFDLLGCSSSPDSKELQVVWMVQPTLFCGLRVGGLRSSTPMASSTNKRKSPRKKSLADRALKIHRLKAERCFPQKRTGVSSPTSVLSPDEFLLPHHRSRSMDDTRKQLFGLAVVMSGSNDSGRSRIRGSIQNNTSQDGSESASGYDSDPGEVDWGPSPPNTLPVTTPMPCHVGAGGNADNNDDDSLAQVVPSADVHQVVQESLNITWTLTWHPDATATAEPRLPHQATADAAAGASHASTASLHRSSCCNVWVERGTLVNNNATMLEPNLMWRKAYQPAGQRKLTNAMPYSVRLLNLCRIVREYDRSKYPMARPSCTFVIKTADVGDYCFEAATPQDCADVVRRLKLIVARFATLAIVEDMDAIVDEFFARSNVPRHGNPLLIPEDDLDDE